MSEYELSNRVNNNVYILITRLRDPNDIPLDKQVWTKTWQDKSFIAFTKFQIKESDLRTKTATFTSNSYLDLTTGVYAIEIVSKYHENFTGVILSVEDNRDGTYSYQCQDWSRLYQGKFSLILKNVKYYDVLRWILTRGLCGVPPSFDKTKLKQYKYMLAGLRPIEQYNSKWWGNSVADSNFMKTTKNIIIEDKTFIEAIRDIVFGSNSYVDVYFDKWGTVQIEPFSKTEWLNKGIYITTKELASRKLKFDTTNVVTGVFVKSNDSLSPNNLYTSSVLTGGLDLSVFFGRLSTTIANPVTNTTTKTTNTTNNTTSSNSKDGNGTAVHINTDRIGSLASDKKLMSDIRDALKKRGYGSITIGARNPNAHYSEVNKIPQNGIYLTLYGGLCAGTINEQITSSHFKNALKKKNAKMVIGHKEPNKTTKWRLTDKLTWLPRAHDDNFSPKSFKGISNPRKKILDAGIGIAAGTSASEIASNFPGFKNSTNTTTNTGSSTAIIDTETSQNIDKEKAEALKEIQKPLRDLLNMKITLPLGNLSLKNLHTNMFCYTELPDTLENFDVLSKALKGAYTRYQGYKLSRWYIEAVTINYDNGKYEMELDLNPFPSDFVGFKENRNAYVKAYTDASKNNNTSSNNTNTSSSNTQSESDNYTNVGNRTDGKTACQDTFYLTTKRGQINISKLVNSSENKLSRQWIGKTGTNYHNFVKGCKTAKEVYKKLCTIIPVKVASYANCKYKCPENAFNHPKNLNCAERSRLFKACCDSLQIPCVIYHVENHYMNGVLINGKWKTADLCYRSGIRHKDYQTAGFNK